MSRHGRHVFVLLALVVFLGGSVAPFFSSQHLGFDDDSACEPGIGVSGSTQAALTTPTPDSTPAHCAVCHWVRTANGAQAAVALTGTMTFVPLPPPELVQIRWVGPSASSHTPPRAPPASL